jgi:hypothetical protein
VTRWSDGEIGFAGQLPLKVKSRYCDRWTSLGDCFVSSSSLEKRVAQLELQVSKLQSEIGSGGLTQAKDWRRTIGMFTDDEGMKEVFKEARKIRAADRRKTR